MANHAWCHFFSNSFGLDHKACNSSQPPQNAATLFDIWSQDEVQGLGGIPDEGSVFHRQVNAETKSHTTGSPPLGFGLGFGFGVAFFTPSIVEIVPNSSRLLSVATKVVVFYAEFRNPMVRSYLLKMRVVLRCSNDLYGNDYCCD